MDDRFKKWGKQGVILLAEAVVFGIGLELSKDLYQLIKGRAQGESSSEEALPPDDVADDPIGD